VKVGIALAPPTDDVSGWLADAAAFEAAGADALWVDGGSELDAVAMMAALAAVTYRCQLVADVAGSETLDRLSRGRLCGVPDGEWHRVPVPENRAAWRAALAEAAELGVAGLVVPADAKLIDLLRNPEEPQERLDVYLAQG
jgi:hypothetical protein